MDVLTPEFSTWLGSFVETCKNYSIDVTAYASDWKAGLSLALCKEQESPLIRLNHLLKLVGERLPPYSFWHGKLMPILIIDEANELNTLTHDSDSHTALTDLFKLFVKNIKEANRFHTLLTMISSDSFFHIWMTRYSYRFNKTYNINLVIGNLTKEDAEVYWRERLLPHAPGIPFFPDFETVYTVAMWVIFSY